MDVEDNPTGTGGYTGNAKLTDIENAKMSELVAQGDSYDEEYPQVTFSSTENFRAAMRAADSPKLEVELPVECFQIFGASVRLPLGKAHLNRILTCLDDKVRSLQADKDRFMSNVRYECRVSHWGHIKPFVDFKLKFDDSRVKADGTHNGEGKFIGYRNDEGEIIPFNTRTE